MSAGEQDRQARRELWAQQARGRSVTYRAQAATAADSADAHHEQADRMIERLAERNPRYGERLLAIRASADARRAATAERKRDYAARRAGDQPLVRPRRPEAAVVAELETYLRDMAAVQERDRISAELRGRVIRRVFTAGLELQSAAGLTEQPEVRSRIHGAADILDEVIRIIRDTIFGPTDRPTDHGPGQGPGTGPPPG
jgi:signal transduction histidine kinase